MSAITNIWRQLVQRRLWPVAIVLVAALPGIPLALAKTPEPVEPPATAAVPEGDLSKEPLVTLATATTETRRVLGKAKNPFGVPKRANPTSATSTASKSSTTSTSSKTSSGSSTTSGSSMTTGGTPTTATPTPVATPTPAPAKEYELYELDVRFGLTSAPELPDSTLKRLTPLPSDDEPLLVYLGVEDDGKTAIFLIDKSLEVNGDARCEPRPEQCEEIHMKAGDTVFLDVKSPETGELTAQYELDLVKIHNKTTTSSVRAKASAAGRVALKARAAAGGEIGWRLDPATGTLRDLTPED